MDNLSLHIQYLLLHHDCVVIPGVGAFINALTAATYNEVERTWLPPMREIRFNGALKYNDGLLISSYARKNSIGFEEGREILRKDISRLKESLEIDGEVTIGNLGILRQTDDSMVFHPLRTSEDLNRLLGYFPVKVPQLDSNENTAPAIEEETVNADGTSEKKSTRRVRQFNTAKNYYIAINKIFARSAACVLVAAIIILSFIHPGIDHKVIEQANVLPVESIIREKITPVQTSRPQDNEKIKSDRTTMDVTPDELTSEDYAFQLIVATFTSLREAENFIASKDQCNYKLIIIPTSKRFRVSAKGADNKEELISVMNSAEFKSRFSESWIWGNDRKLKAN